MRFSVEIDCELYALEYRKTEYTYNNEEQRHLRNYLAPNSHRKFWRIILVSVNAFFFLL